MTISLLRPNINIELYTPLYVRAKTPTESFNKADSLPFLDKRKQSATVIVAKERTQTRNGVTKNPLNP